jgi:WD40 repeat protein
MAVIIAAAIIAWVQKREADRQRYTAQRQLALNYWDNGRKENDAGNFFLGLHLKARAVAACPDPNLSSAIIQNTDQSLNAAVLRSVHPKAPSEVLFACNEIGYVLAEDKDNRKIQLLDVASGTPTGHSIQLEIPHGGESITIRGGCSPLRLLIGVLDSIKTGGGSIQLLDFESGRTRTHHLDAGMFPINFSSDLKRYLISTSDNTYQVRAVADGRNIGPPIIPSQRGWTRLSDNGKHVVVSGYKEVVQLYDVQTGLQFRNDIIHEDRGGFHAVLSPRSEQLVTWDNNRQLRIWDLKQDVTTSFSVFLEHDIRGAMYFKKKRLLLIWDAGLHTHILNPNSGKILIGNLSHSHGRPIVSPDERYILTFTKESGFLWEAATGRRLAGLFHPPLPQAIFLGDGDELITLDKDRAVRWWNLRSLDKRYRVVRPTGGIVSAQWDSKSQGIFTLSKWAVEQWDVATGNDSEEILSFRTLYDGFLYSKQTNRILVWGKRIARKYFASLIETIHNKPTQLSIDVEIESATLSPNHGRFFIILVDGTAELRDFDSGEMIDKAAIQDQKITDGIFSPNGQHLLLWTEKGEAVMWDTHSSFDNATPFSPGLSIHGAVWSVSHKLLLTWDRKGLATLWKRPIQQSDKITFQHGGEVKDSVFNEKSEQIVTWTTDDVIHFWDFQGNKTTLPAKGPISGLSLSPDPKSILTWSTNYPGQAILWDVASGREIIRYPHEHMIGCLGFSADQKYIVTHSRQECRIWQLPGDLDFPNTAYRLKAEALTGTRLHEPSNSVRLLPREEWLKLRQRYIELDREHAKTCSFKNQNTYLNFFKTEQMPSLSPDQ